MIDLERANKIMETINDLPDQDLASEGSQCSSKTHIVGAPSLLNIYVQTYEQAQKLRLETMNRMRCWLRDTIPKEEWSDKNFNDKNIMESEILPNDLRDFVKHIEQLEKDAAKYLRREMKNNELWPWLSSIRGIGEILAGRLLHRLGDLKRFPSPAHLWSYCGLDGTGWRNRPHNWALTSICYNIAESFQKQPMLSGGYRDIYDNRKEYEQTKGWCGNCLTKAEKAQEKKTGEKVIREICIPAHINNKARRYAVKEFLKDLWAESNK